MGGETLWEASLPHSSLHHSGKVVRIYRVRGQSTRPAFACTEQPLAVVSIWKRVEVLTEKTAEVVASGDLPALSALIDEVELMLFAVVIEVPTPQLRDRADAGGRVDQRRDDCPVAEAKGGDASESTSVALWPEPS